jgi:hypothetical protein
MIKHLLIAVVIALSLSCGRNEPLSNYEPKSPRERALKGVLLDFQEGVNKRNPDKIGDLLHESALMMVGRERKILPKAAYVKLLPKRLAENPPVSLGKPRIAIDGENAEVKIYMTRGDYNGLVVFKMILDHDKWYIQSWKY